jgi:hypothetical protein
MTISATFDLADSHSSLRELLMLALCQTRLTAARAGKPISLTTGASLILTGTSSAGPGFNVDTRSFCNVEPLPTSSSLSKDDEPHLTCPVLFGHCLTRYHVGFAAPHSSSEGEVAKLEYERFMQLEWQLLILLSAKTERDQLPAVRLTTRARSCPPRSLFRIYV